MKIRLRLEGIHDPKVQVSLVVLGIKHSLEPRIPSPRAGPEGDVVSGPYLNLSSVLLKAQKVSLMNKKYTSNYSRTGQNWKLYPFHHQEGLLCRKFHNFLALKRKTRNRPVLVVVTREKHLIIAFFQFSQKKALKYASKFWTRQVKI